MVGGGQWGDRAVTMKLLPDGNPTDVVAGDISVGIQKQRVIFCGVCLLVETKDYLAIARV